MTEWLRRRALRTIHEFHARLARYQLQQRRQARDALQQDPVVSAAVADHAKSMNVSEADVRRRVDEYISKVQTLRRP